MTRIANSEARTYRSELRAEQAEETRRRILDATVRVMARAAGQPLDPGGRARGRGLGSDGVPALRHEATTCSRRCTRTSCGAAGLDQLPPPRSSASSGRAARSTSRASTRSTTWRARPWPARPPTRCGGRTCRAGSRGSARLADSIEPQAVDGRPGPAHAAARGPHRSRRRCACGAITSGSSVEEAADDIDWVVRAAIAAAERSRGTAR